LAAWDASYPACPASISKHDFLSMTSGALFRSQATQFEPSRRCNVLSTSL
jgi:hypothetical protein